MAIDWEYYKKKAKKIDEENYRKNISNDIAPVRTQTPTPSTAEDSKWFQKSALFNDGWDKGDVSKTVKASGTDVAENAGAGFMGAGEKILDFLAFLGTAMNGQQMQTAAQNEMMFNAITGKDIDGKDTLEKYRSWQKEAEKGTEEFIKKDLYDEQAIAKKIITAPLEQKWGINVETDSIFGQKSDELAQSAGQLGATAIASMFGAGSAMIGATAFGGEMESALNQGATYNEAAFSSMVSAGAEILTEKISGGIKFGGKTLDETLTKRLTSSISNNVARKLVSLGMDAAGEGFEEVLSGTMSAIGQKLSYASDKELNELFSSEDAWNSFVGGAILGGLSSGGKNVKAKIKGVDSITGLTKNEQAVFDKVYNDRINEAKNGNKKLSSKDKSNIFNSVMNDLERGRIGIDTIESVLGGETYKQYQSAVEKDNQMKELQKEYDSLYRMKNGEKSDEQIDRQAELKQQLEEYRNTSKLTEIKKQLSNEVSELAKTSKLAESYNEKSRRSQTFEADLTQYDEKHQGTYKRAMESGVLNNTNRTHEFVDLLAKLEADKGVLFDFTNNEKIKASGFAIEGKQVNGYVQGNNIAINIDSTSAFNKVVGHEITHVLEGTELYTELANAVKELATTKGEYDSKLQSITKLYEGIENINIENELTAELIGEYLFTDTDFINRLSAEKPTLFQKIFDEIKYLCKVATAGSKEAKQLEKVKKTFEEAYRQKNNTATDDGVKYSVEELSKGKKYVKADRQVLSGNDPKKWGEQVTDYINNTIRNGKNVIVYAQDGDALTITENTAGKAAFRNDVKLQDGTSRPMTDEEYAVKLRAESHIDELSQVSRRGKKTVPDYKRHSFAKDGFNYRTAFFMDADGKYYRLTLSVGKNGVINTVYNVGKIKEEGEYSLRGSKPVTDNSVTMRSPSSNNSLPQENTTVNNNSMQKSEKNSLSDENQDIASVGKNNVYGEDIKLQSASSEDIAPIGENVVRKTTESENTIIDGDEPIQEIQSMEKTKSTTHEDLVKQMSDIMDENYISFEDFTNSNSSVWKNVDYNDETAKTNILREVHQDMVNDGVVVEIADDVKETVAESYPDLRSMKKKDRTPILKEAMNKLKSNLRTFLNGFKNQSFEFEVSGKVLEAKLYNTGINEVLEKITQDKAEMLYSTKEIFRNARYLYSTPDYDGDPNVYRWNYFYTPVKIGEDTVGVRIAVRDVAEGTKGHLPESQIYNWGIKKDTSLDGESYGPKVASSDVSSDVSTNIILNNEQNVNTNKTGEVKRVMSVKGELKSKLFSYYTELHNNVSNREKALAEKDEVISQLQAEYDKKKNKNSQTANKLLMRIEKEQRLKNNISAEYSKHISKIEKKIRKTEDKIEKLTPYDDELEKRLSRIDSQFEKDKLELKNEFEQKKADLKKTVSSKGKYISEKSLNLYREMIKHKKGEQLSDELQYFLDMKFEWNTLKSTLVAVNNNPLNPKSEFEKIVYEAMSRDYESKLYELNDLDSDYYKQLAELEKKTDEKRKAARRANQAKLKKLERFIKFAKLAGDTSTWKDKKSGYAYSTETEHRNFRDIVRNKYGKKDIERADALHDALGGNYNNNEALMKKEEAEIKQKYIDLKINKYESQYIHMVFDKRYNPKTVIRQKEVSDYYDKHKKKIDTDKVEKAIAYAREDFEMLFIRRNEVLRDEGMKEIPYHEGYIPHFYDKRSELAKFLDTALNWKVPNKNEVPTDIEGLTKNFKPNKSWQAFAQEREGERTEYNFLKVMDTHIHGSLDWIYHIPDIQDRRAFENYLRLQRSEKGIQDKFDEIYSNEEYDANEMQEQIDLIFREAKNPLNNFVIDLRKRTDSLAGKRTDKDRELEQKWGKTVYSVLTNASNRVSANAVVGSISAALTNFIPITQSWAEVSPFSSVRAMRETIKSAVKDDGIVDKSVFLTNRLRIPKNLYKTFWDNASDVLGVFMEVADNFTSQTVWRSKYNENLSKGMSEAEAIKNADEFTEGLIAGRSRGNMPTIFDSKNPVTKTFTAFQLEVNNQYRYLFKDLPQNLANEAKLKLVKAYVSVFIGANVFNALYSSLAGRDAAFDPINIIKELLGDLFDDEEEELGENIGDAVKNLAGNLLDETPFVGGVLGEGGRVPLSSALPYGDGIWNAFEGTVTDLSEGDLENLTKEWLSSVGAYVLAPVAGGQIKKTAQGLSMFDDDFPIAGSYTDSGKLRFKVEETPGNIAQAAVFGQYASKTARQYFDEEHAPLSDKQTKELVDIQASMEEYWEYQKGLKKLGKDATLAEKIDYIADLEEFDTWQKNIMANNLTTRKEPIDLMGYEDIGNFEEFDYAMKNPEKYAISKAVGGYDNYIKYSEHLGNITAEKDKNGNSVSGSRKKKVVRYINNLDIEFGEKMILYRSQYKSDDTYNAQIVEYLNDRNDITHQDKITILTELGFKVLSDGTVKW